MGSHKERGDLEERLGYRFSNKQYLESSLAHPSVSSNREFQRLEFLGDAVLNLCISTYLYNNFSDLNEGELTLYRSLIVKKSSLIKISNNLGLEHFIEFNGNNNLDIPKSVVSDTVEAIIGAIYLDANDISKVYEIVINLFFPLFDELLELTQKYDYKSLLQQNAQKRGLPVPTYNLVKTSALKNKSVFEVAVEIDGKIVGYGIGRTIKESQQNAAKNALDVLLGNLS